ncbi:tryptophan 7-halogenase [Yinghuangia sp. YIM S10712]|uniref:tryptophan 7-halogenase n=1 Tax=Yinghuangia sp. YIM S10712 TaxID=3436930 RepID=UPI003F532DD4
MDQRECNAAYKVAGNLINWCTPGPREARTRKIDGRPDHFHHPFGLLPEHDGLPLSHQRVYNRKNGTTRKPFDYSCFPGVAVMDRDMAPRNHAGEPITRYAWHFDAHLVALFLRRYSTDKQCVRHVQDEMVEVQQDERGFVTALRTKGRAVLDADLIVDCSGFRGHFCRLWGLAPDRDRRQTRSRAFPGGAQPACVGEQRRQRRPVSWIRRNRSARNAITTAASTSSSGTSGPTAVTSASSRVWAWSRTIRYRR